MRSKVVTDFSHTVVLLIVVTFVDQGRLRTSHDDANVEVRICIVRRSHDDTNVDSSAAEFACTTNHSRRTLVFNIVE